jgi:hypothetical protein
MEMPPAFFVPATTPENQESIYAELAKMGQCSVPAMSSRVYSITYTHDGEEWTATVGEPLKGVRYKTSRVKGKKIERVLRLSDPAVVLAIFPGNPYIVITNHRLAKNVGSGVPIATEQNTTNSI